jgi:hypothetical protein
VGLDAHKVDSWSGQRELLIEHLRKLRATKELRKLPIVLVVESNLGFEAAHNARYVVEAGVENVYVAHERGSAAAADGRPTASTMDQYAKNSVGVRTTHASKERMYMLLRQALEDDALRVADCCVCRGEVDVQRKKLTQQMHNYSAVVSQASSVFSDIRRVFSGKAMGEQDDLLVALMIAVLYRRVYMNLVSGEAGH